MIVIGNVQDSGKYTCELDSDEDDPLSVTHTLQILGDNDNDNEGYVCGD